MMKDERRLKASVVRGFERIAKSWNLSNNQMIRLIGVLSINRFHAICLGEISPTEDNLKRAVCVIKIDNALKVLVPGSSYNWVHRPNSGKIFGGKPALELMSSGNIKDLELVRDYLLTELHGPFS